MRNYITKLSEKLIEDHPEEYQTRWCSYGTYNNGVGMASYGGEWEYDEESAFNDAADKLISDLENKNLFSDDLLGIFTTDDIYYYLKNKINTGNFENKEILLKELEEYHAGNFSGEYLTDVLYNDDVYNFVKDKIENA